MNNNDAETPRPLSTAERRQIVRSLQESDQAIAAFLGMLNKSDPRMFQDVLHRASKRILGVDWNNVPIDDPKTFAAVTNYVGLMALHARISTEVVRTNDPHAEDIELLAKRDALETLLKNTEAYTGEIVAKYEKNLELSEILRKKTERAWNLSLSWMVTIAAGFGLVGAAFGYLLAIVTKS